MEGMEAVEIICVRATALEQRGRGGNGGMTCFYMPWKVLIAKSGSGHYATLKRAQRHADDSRSSLHLNMNRPKEGQIFTGPLPRPLPRRHA
jgi:hypothetical protein